MNCDCGRPLETYVVTVDEEQTVEDLCPHCNFPKPEPLPLYEVHQRDVIGNKSDSITLLEGIDDAVADLRMAGRKSEMLITSPKTLEKLRFEVAPHIQNSNSKVTQITVGGFKLDVVVDASLPDDKVILVDTSKIRHQTPLVKPSNPFDLLPKKPFVRATTRSGTPLNVESLDMDTSVSHNTTATLQLLGGFTHLREDVNLVVGGQDMGTWHVVGQRTVAGRDATGRFTPMTEINLIGAK